MPSWDDVPEEIKLRFPPPPIRSKFNSDEEYEEARAYWSGRIGRNIGFVMQSYYASLPDTMEFHLDNGSDKDPQIIMESKKIDWKGNVVGSPAKTTLSIEEIKQLINYCLHCNDTEIRNSIKGMYEDFLT